MADDPALIWTVAFGRYVRRLREVRNLTQDRLAELSDLTGDTIRRLEHHQFSPSLRTLYKVCNGLNITLSALFVSFELPEDSPVFRDLVMLLRGRDDKTIALVLRLVQELLDHIDQTPADRSSAT